MVRTAPWFGAKSSSPRTGKRAITLALFAGFVLAGAAVAIFSRKAARESRAEQSANTDRKHSSASTESEALRDQSPPTRSATETKDNRAKVAEPPHNASAPKKEAAGIASTPTKSHADSAGKSAGSTTSAVQSRKRDAAIESDGTKRAPRVRLDRPLDFERLAQGIRDKYALAAGRDAAAELAQLRQRLEAGDNDTAMALGLFLAYGEDFTPDPALAAVYFEKAANAGNARAKTELGRLYLSGNGVAADAARAATLFRTAWDAGDAEGAFLLAAANRSNLFPGADPAEAASLFAAAADRGHTAAQKVIYDLNKSGDLKFASSEQVSAWLKQAAATGDADAVVNLAKEYAKSGRAEEAHALLEKAAVDGSFHALQALMAMTKINPREPSTYRNIVRLHEAHTADPEQAPADTFLMLSFFQSMVTNDAATRAQALETLRAAADRGNSRARLALQSTERGQVLATAILDAQKLNDAGAYATWLQRRENTLSEFAPADVAPVPRKAVQPIRGN